MSADKARKLLVSLQDDPENEKAWTALEEGALGGDFAAAGSELRAQLAETRKRFAARGEAEATARILDVEIELTEDPAARGLLLRERAFVLEEELLDDKSALAALERLVALGVDPEASAERDRVAGKKAKWKELAQDYRQRAENDSTDPTVVASLLVSAAGIILQYKSKVKDKDVDSVFEDALQVDPGNLRAVQLYERILRRRGRSWDVLTKLLETSAEAVSDNEERGYLLLRAARTHAARRHDLGAAERDYRRALALDPGNADALRFLAVILQDAERWDDLARLYEAALARADAPDIGLLVQAGMTHWRMRNDPGSAEPHFARLRALVPDHPVAKNFFESFDASDEISFDDGGEELLDEQLSSEVLESMLPGPDTVHAVVHGPPVVVPAAPRVPEIVEATEPEAAPAVEAAPIAEAAPAIEAAPVVEAAPAVDAAPAVEAAPIAEAAPEDEAVAQTETPSAEAVATKQIDAPAAAEASEPEAPAPRASVPPPPRPVTGGHPVVNPTPRTSTRPVAPAAVAGNRIQAAVEMAQQAESAGHLDRAIDAWKAVLRQEPAHPDARNNLVRLYSAAARWNNLVELYRQELDALGGVRPGPEAQQNKERKLEILHEMVAIYRDRLALEPMVVQTYNAILGIEPSDRASLIALAASYEKLGRYTDVIKVLDQQVQSSEDPTEKVGLLRRIAALWVERFNNVNNATRPLEQIVEIDPTDVDALQQLKDLYTKRRAWRPLFEVLRREAALLDGDRKRDALIELARLASDKLSSNGEAIGLWREALALDRDAPGALDALEKLTDREKDWAGLAEVLERRVDEASDPEQKVAVLMKLGVVFGERLEDPARAVEAWQRVLVVRPGHPKALRVLRDGYVAASRWDDLEALYGATNDWEGLADVLGQSAEKAADPAVKVALSFRAAKVYEEKLGQAARAFRSYERVLSVEPRNLDAAQALVPIYLADEKWPRLAQLYEILLGALGPSDVDASLDLLQKLREISANRLGDRAAAFEWAHRAYELRADDDALEAQLEKSAEAANTWGRFVATLDARAARLDDAAERARLRDKAAAVEADRLDALDAAIARYQRALAASPDDAHVVSTLDGFLRRAARWQDLRDLFDHRLARVEDPTTRRALRFEVAEVEELQLSLPEAASARFRGVLAESPADPEALSALSRLAEEGGRWPELAQLVAARRDLASGDTRADLAFKLGALKVARLDDTAGAIEDFREALALVAHHKPSLEALEALLREEAWRVTAAKILEPEFEAIGDHRRLAWVLQILLEAETAEAFRADLALRLAEVYHGPLADPRTGFELLRRVFEEQPGTERVADALSELAASGGWNEELAQTLSTVTRREGLAPEVSVALARRTAAVYDQRQGDAAAAEPFHAMVIASGALDLHAFASLKRHYQERERWSDLRGLYARWVERTPDRDGQIELLLEEALVLEEILDQPAEAAGVYERVLALDEAHTGAARALDRLLVRLSRWSDLEALLGRRIALAGEGTDDARELRFRRGEVREHHLGRPDLALEDYAAVLDDSSQHPEARAGLERLLSNSALRAQAAAVLEPRYEADGDPGAESYVRMVLVRLEFTATPAERSALWRKVADQREIVLHDAVAAFDAIAQALTEEPDSESLREELLRLSTLAAQDARAAESLEKAAADPRAEAAKVAILRDLANLYDDRLFDHTRAEQSFRRLLAAAPDDPEVVGAAALALERLYRGLQNPRGLVEALTLRARFEADDVQRRALYAQAAEILEDELADLPGAIVAQQKRLEIDPTDRDALKALARLYERTAAWSELVVTLRRDAELADDPDAQKALLVQAAAVLEARLAAVPEAIALYRDVLESHGADRTIHAALARLYELSDAWPELLGVLEQDLGVATEPSDRLAIIVRQGEIRRTRTGEQLKAVENYRDALDLEASHPTVRGALEGLLGSTEKGVALAAARALDPVLQSESAWDKLVTVLDRIAADTDEPDERRQALARGADACEIGLEDAGKAFDRAALELRESLSDAEVGLRLERVEGLARASNRHGDLVKVLQEVGPELLDPTLQRGVYMKVAEVSRDALSDLGTARTYFEKVLDLQSDDAPALDALERLHGETSAWPELLAVLRRKTELAGDADVQRALLRKQAEICELRLENRAEAIRAHEAILELGFDREAALALERLYAAEGRWDDLASLLEAQLPIDGSDVADLHFRLGSVAMDHLGDQDRALEHFRAVLEVLPDHAPTVAKLEALGSREGFAAPTAVMLEPIYRARMDTPKLIGALEARIAAETDVVERKALLGNLGTLYEESVGDLNTALGTYARVFREELSDRSTWDVLARLARQTDGHARLAAIYAEALRGVEIDDDTSAELAFVTARLFDEKVGNAAEARVWYRRALAFDPTRDEVFRALEALLLRESAWDELLALYREAADRADDLGARKALLFKIAELDEHRRGDAVRAIQDYREILDTDPADREAIERLDALLVQTAAWQDLAELLEKRINDALDSDERAIFRFRLGKLRVERLDDARGAIEAFREILDEKRDHREAIRALEAIADGHAELRLSIVEILEPIYRELDDWRRLVVALNLRLGASEDAVERGQLLREIGRIKETRDNDVRAAFAAYSQAFAADPADGEAREAAERLAAEHGLWDDLVATYETALKTTDDAVIKGDLLRAVAATHDQRRDDPRQAIDAYNRLFAVDETQLDVLDLLENLHVLLSDWEGHVEVLERKVERSLDDEIRTFLLRQIGEQQRDMLGNAEKGIDAFRRALEIDPSDLASLEALDGLYAARRDLPRLADVLQQRLDIENDPELRRMTALRLGKLWETELGDAQKATDAYRRVLDDQADDRDALAALERLYERQESWSDLLDNLKTQAAMRTDDGARVPLWLRVGALQAERLNEPESALESYRQVLSVDAGNATALAAVVKLSQDDDQRGAAVEVLEPIFRSARRWDELVATLERKLTGIDDPAQRLGELRGLAGVHEQGRGDASAAFATWQRALHEDASDFEARVELERLAAALNRWSDLVTLLEQEAENTTDPMVASALSSRAAELSRDQLQDDARAVTNYQRAVEQTGDDDEILAALDALHQRNSQWRELLDVLERRVNITSTAELDGLEVRAGELRERRFNDAPGALQAYRNVLDRVSTQADALAGVERLLRLPAVRVDAVEALEGAYLRNDDAARLAWLTELKVNDADLDGDKVRLLGELARLREERLGDLSGALNAQIAAFGIDPRDEQVLLELERLAPAAGDLNRLRGVVEEALAKKALDTSDVAALNLRAAGWYLAQLNDSAAAEERLLAALAAEPENLDAIEQLEGVRRAPGREADLVATLRRRSELELDIDARKTMLREAATLAETKLNDLDEAASLTALLLETDEADLEALDTLARLRKSQGQHEAVAELLSRRARLTDDPAQVVALRREVAELYAGPLDDTDRAIAAWKDLLDFDPNDTAARDAFEALLSRSARWRDLEDALRARLDVAVSSDERAVIRLRLAALAETRFNDPNAAADFLRDVLDEVPTHVEAGNGLERIYAAEKRFTDLGELLERRAEDFAAAGDTANELGILVRIGDLAEREMNDTARAVELYERVLDRNPDHVGALEALARLAEKDGHWQRAAEMLGRALALAPSGPEGAALGVRLAELQRGQLGRPDDAEVSLRRALALDPLNRPAIARLKVIADETVNHALFVEAFKLEVRAVSDVKEKVALYKSIASLSREKLGDNAGAIEALEAAVALDGEDREVLLSLVDLYAANGREGDAIPIVERIIASFGTRRTKELAQWQHRLGRAYEAAGDPMKALALYDQAFKIDLTNVPILRDLGLLCLQLGDFERAQKSFRALLLQRLEASHNITKADVYFHLGETLSRQGDKPKAIGMLERALEADKAHARARELLTELKG